MKKLLGIVVLGLLLCTNANSKITIFKKGGIHEGDVYWKHRKITLPPGKWESVERWGWSEGFWDAGSVTLVQYTNNYLTTAFSFGEIDFKARYQGYIAPLIDEFIGQSIPICLYEIAHEGTKETSQILTFYFIMFILFRLFDIAKPYPVSYYDKNFKNSFGVIMDDVCAGLYVVAVLVLYMVITT